MSTFLDTLKQTTVLADGAMGTLLFRRTGRLSEHNHVYEAFNIDRPQTVTEAHFAYLQAGACCLTSNTFGANRTQLESYGEAGRLAAINRAGVELARRAIAEFQAQSDSTAPCFVLGSIGPTPRADEPVSRLASIYGEQIDALLETGIDALEPETFINLEHAIAVIELIRQRHASVPIAIQMALRHTSEGQWTVSPADFVTAAAAAGANVVGINCCSPWEATAFVDEVMTVPAVSDGTVQVSAEPNAGGYHRIGHRYMSDVNPEFMGKLARTFSERGLRLIGGCCEVHPAHINEMHNYLQGRQAGNRAVVVASAELTPAGDAEKRGNGGFSRKIKDGEFAISVEMLPSRGTSATVLASKVEFVETLAASGLADALDITDGSRGIPLLPPGDFAGVLRERLGWTADSGDALELIPHVTTRDLNVMGLQSRLMGYHHRNIHNVVIITGDPPKMSPTYPRSTAVFDLDSVDLVNFTHACLNAGIDFGGQPLSRQENAGTHFTIGSGFEPEAVNLERELEKLRNKIGGGADYIMTQPAFRFELLAVLDPLRTQTAVIVGVMLLANLDHARRVADVPGVCIPNEICDRLAAYETPEDQAKTGIDIAAEQVRRVRAEGWAGLYLMSPATHRPVLEVLQHSVAR